jgi:hypothetical protein
VSGRQGKGGRVSGQACGVFQCLVSRTHELNTHTYIHMNARGAGSEGKRSERERIRNDHSRILLFHIHHICSVRVRRSEGVGKGMQGAGGRAGSNEKKGSMQGNA